MRLFICAVAISWLVILGACSKPEVAFYPSFPSPPVSQTIITPAPFPKPDEDKRLDGFLHPLAFPSQVDGKTAYVSSFKPETLLTPLLGKVDLGNLVTPGKPPRLLALGGSLTAGVRNGGLYREGQLTAYPNLVARQMGIADFRSPAFAEGEANGTGFLVYADADAPYPRWRQVTNQLAPVQAGDPPVLSPYRGTVDNYAVPGMYGDLFDRQWHPEIRVAPYENGHQWLDSQPLLWRFFPSQLNQTTGLTSYLTQNTNYDFFLLEDKTDMWLQVLRKNDFLNGLRYIYEFQVGQFDYKKTALALAQGGRKGVVMTMPSFEDFAFMQWYPTDELKKKASLISITYRTSNYPEELRRLDASKEFFFMPTPAVARLFKNFRPGDVVSESLTDADIMDEVESRSSRPDVYNEQVRKMAAELNLALVDLQAIYKQIHQGSYLTEDGLKIDGSPRGNFFSADGTYPTAIGQAVIANEVIKAINRQYKARIPLINIQDFRLTTGAK